MPVPQWTGRGSVRGRLAFAQTGELDRDVLDRIGEHLGRGDDQVGSGHFWDLG
jgi:hypothetical protein